MTVIDSTVISEKEDGDFKSVTSVVVREETKYYWKGVRLPSDVIELLDELARADGFGERIVIYNDKLAKALEAGGYVYRNARGSYGGNEKKIKVLKEEIRKFYKDVG